MHIFHRYIIYFWHNMAPFMWIWTFYWHFDSSSRDHGCYCHVVPGKELEILRLNWSSRPNKWKKPPAQRKSPYVGLLNNLNQRMLILCWAGNKGKKTNKQTKKEIEHHSLRMGEVAEIEIGYKQNQNKTRTHKKVLERSWTSLHS